jgi:enoyl-[acyl-carrier protein] reductase I
LIAIAKAASPLMVRGGSIIAMSYYGAEKVIPHYNVMGVAKAALKPTRAILLMILDNKKSELIALAPVLSIL